MGKLKYMYKISAAKRSRGKRKVSKKYITAKKLMTKAEFDSSTSGLVDLAPTA